jgi:O-antigen/teichoic acid export membrane protein
MKQLAEWLAALKNNGVARSIFGVGGAAAASQVITLASAPLLSRLYDQAAFGQFSAFFGFANIMAALCLFGLNDAMIAARRPEASLALLAAGLWLLLGLAAPAGVFVYFAIQRDWFGLGTLPTWAAPLFVAELVCLVLLSYFQMLLVRAQRYQRIATAYLALGFGRTAGQLGGGLTGLGFYGLAGGEFIGRLVSIVWMGHAIRHDLKRALVVPIRAMAASVSDYRHFPILRTPSTVASAVGVGAPAILMFANFGSTDAGHFGLMTTALSAPLALVQKSVGDVFLGHFSKRFADDRSAALRLLFRIMLVMAAMALVGGGLLIAAGPTLFALVFGAEWARAGEMARLAAPMVMAQLVVLPISTAIIVANRPEVKIAYDLLFLAAVLGAYVWSAERDALAFVAALSVLATSATTCYSVLILWACRNPRADKG